jgi:hypothetical protein
VALANPGEGIEGLERWTLDHDDGVVEAFFIPGRGCTPDQPGPAVIFAHGNGELIDYWPEMLAPFRELGVSLLLPEYRGYGRSAGEPSEDGIVEDYVQYYDRLVERPEVDPSRVVFVGRSLGGGVVSALARRRAPAALILQSTFTSVPALAARWYVPRILIRDAFDTLDLLERGFRAPVLVFHGTEDTLIPVSHARQLARAVDAELVLYAAGHNDLPPAESDYWDRVERFLRAHHILGPPTR